jgi:hypothetical protein
MNESNDDYDVSSLKSEVKEDLKEFWLIYFVETAVLGIILLFPIGFILLFLTGGRIEDYYDQNPIPVAILMFGIPFTLSRILVVRHVRKLCIVKLRNARKARIERDAEWRRKQEREMLYRQRHPEEYNQSPRSVDDPNEALYAEYQANLHNQMMNQMEAEEAERAQRNAYSANTVSASDAGKFYGVDGQWYTKDDSGYIRREGSSEIIGQNGRDYDGHRIEHY